MTYELLVNWFQQHKSRDTPVVNWNEDTALGTPIRVVAKGQYTASFPAARPQSVNIFCLRGGGAARRK